MKYTSDQYLKSTILFKKIITGLLIFWGISSFLPYGFKWLGSGLIPLGIGIGFLSSGIASRANRRKSKKAVLDEVTVNPDASVDEISRSIGIISNYVIKIMLDLKASGEILGKFSSSTRQMKQVIIPAQTEMKFSKEKPSEKKENYCPNCGTAVAKEPVEYCAYCGAKLTLSPLLF